jgi:hypothetical protein
MFQAESSSVRNPMRSLNFFNLLNPSSRIGSLSLLSLLTEMSIKTEKIYFWGVEHGRRLQAGSSCVRDPMRSVNFFQFT